MLAGVAVVARVQVIPQIKGRPLGVVVAAAVLDMIVARVVAVVFRAVRGTAVQVAAAVGVFPDPVAPVVGVGQTAVTVAL